MLYFMPTLCCWYVTLSYGQVLERVGGGGEITVRMRWIGDTSLTAGTVLLKPSVSNEIIITGNFIHFLASLFLGF